jgi:hypothetical protein
LKTSAAAILRRKKSYHSMVVPVALANATFLTEVSSRISRDISSARDSPFPPVLQPPTMPASVVITLSINLIVNNRGDCKPGGAGRQGRPG